MKIIWFILLLACLGIAWYLGFRARSRMFVNNENIPNNKNPLPRNYLIGLNFLINEETDKAVDFFIKILAVDSETVETHLAVGKLFRRRGEVDRAIRIHQNLIARPQLDRIYREQSLYELGQDYLSAGMFDRAEKVLLNLIETKSYASQALLLLIGLYQQEKNWEKAIEVATQYEKMTKQSMHQSIAHYYCELAELYLQKNEQDAAMKAIQKASAINPQSVRASLLEGKLLLEMGEYKKALKCLKCIKDQDPNYLSEAIELLTICYEKLNDVDGMVAYLRELLEAHPKVPVVLILSERIREWKGDKVAINFVADYVRRFPSLRGLSLFLNLFISKVEGQVQDDLKILHNLMKKVLSNRPEYQCTSCGYSGKTLHWLCPGCNAWSTMMPLHNIEEAI